jgi:Na+/proline symporter
MQFPNIGAMLGIKGATVVAGFAGAVVSLSFVKQLSKKQMILSVLVGSVTATYLTSFLLAWLDLGQAAQNGAAFIIGLTAMNIIPGILKLTEWLCQDPVALVLEHLPILGPYISRKRQEPKP